MKSSLIVGCGGFLGAMLRYWIGLLVVKNGGVSMYGTLAVNLLGCFCLGALSSFVAHGKLSSELQLLLQTGLLGALTTFSTFTYDMFALYEKKQFLLLFAMLHLHLVVGFFCFWIALKIVR